MSHNADYAFAPCFAVLAAFHRTLIPDDVFNGLAEFQGEHTFTATTYYPPIDNVPRNITSWLSEKLTIGAESFDENGLGGPAQSQEAFGKIQDRYTIGETFANISAVCLTPLLQKNPVRTSSMEPSNLD